MSTQPDDLPASESPRPAEHRRSGLWNWLLPGMFLMSAFVLILYAAPYLIYHWRSFEAQAEAEAHFEKRRAELKAEALHADERLDVLDKRTHLISLGFREVVRKVSPQVVKIIHYVEPKVKEGDPPIDEDALAYDPENNRRYVQLSSGSGLIMKRGAILTNNHVVRGADRLRVIFASGQSIGIDPGAVAADGISDLAVIKLPEKLPGRIKEDANHTALFADSDKDVHVGDWALAIGSPFEFRQTVTQGIVSAKGRLLPMLDLVELLQTDAALNPGNSGGPLFDLLGRVIGINVAIAGKNRGIGFAIPANTAKKIAEQLLTAGEVPRGYLGIAMQELPAPKAKELKLEDGGIVITQVLRGQAAEKAGLQVGDIILRVNKETIDRFQPLRHFRQLIVGLEPGSEIPLEILRDTERRQVTLTVGKRPANLP